MGILDFFRSKSKPKKQRKQVDNIQDSINIAVGHYKNDRFAQALEMLQDIIYTDFSIYEAHLLLGVINDELCKLQDAKSEIETAIQLNPNSIAAYSVLGDILDELCIESSSVKQKFSELVKVSLKEGSDGNDFSHLITDLRKKYSRRLNIQELRSLINDATNQQPHSKRKIDFTTTVVFTLEKPGADLNIFHLSCSTEYVRDELRWYKPIAHQFFGPNCKFIEGYDIRSAIEQTLKSKNDEIVFHKSISKGIIFHFFSLFDGFEKYLHEVKKACNHQT